MNINVQKLRDTLALLKPVVSRKSSLPITTNVLLQDGKAMATDLEVMVAIEMPEATAPCLVPLALTAEFLKGVPGHLTATLIPKSKETTIACGTVYLTTLAVEGKPADFPPIPKVEGPEIMLDGDRLVAALKDVAIYTATDDSRPMLTGVHLTLGPEVKVAGSDGFRLAVRVVQKGPEEVTTAIIPSRALAVLPALWKKVPKQPLLGDSLSIAESVVAKRLIAVAIDGPKARMRLDLGTASLVCLLISGTYPNYAILVPSPTNWMRVNATDLLRAVAQASGIAADNSGIVRLEWTDKELRVSAQAQEVGHTRITIPADCLAPGHVAVNSRYVLAYLAGKEGFVTLYSDNPSAPTRWEHPGSSSLVIIMPLLVQWDGEPEKAKPAGAAETATEAPTNDAAEDLGDHGPETVEPAPEATAAPATKKKRSKKDTQA